MRWPHRPPGLRWPLHRPRGLARGAGPPEPPDGSRPRSSVIGPWPGFAWPFARVDVAWAAFSVANLAAIVIFSRWETVPFHFIWISLTLLYGFRVWAARPTAWVLAVVVITTGAAIGWDVHTGAQTAGELDEVPLLAAMFWMMVWHAQRGLAAGNERDLVSEENARLLATQRRFLQDASHQLRTPITIALGHAELLAGDLAGHPGARDIEVVVGELTRLRRLGERLLMIAASEDPDFLRPEPVALDRFTVESFRKWLPTSARHWTLGRLDPVLITADRERLGLALDALLENAVRHTAAGEDIKLSVLRDHDGRTARMIVTDSGEGIVAAELDRIFDRFRSGSQLGGARGTGLGLALVRAVARAHGGEVRVRSAPGAGSEFELALPVRRAADGTPGAPGGTPVARPALQAGGAMAAGRRTVEEL
jgi:signal transduction histidine kinase